MMQRALGNISRPNTAQKIHHSLLALHPCRFDRVQPWNRSRFLGLSAYGPGIGRLS